MALRRLGDSARDQVASTGRSQESIAYDVEFLRRTNNGGVWYAVLTALLYAGSAARDRFATVLICALAVHLVLLLLRRRSARKAKADEVARVAVLQSLTFGLFVGVVLWVDRSPQSVALCMVSLCGIGSSGTNSMAIAPGRHRAWVVAANLPAVVALLSTAPATYWPLALTVVAFSFYVVLQGRHVVRGFARARRDAASLRASSKEKRTLLSHLSHDVRTPLTAVGGYLQLARQSHDRSDLMQCLDTAEMQLRSSLDLLNHLLDVARMDFSQSEAKLASFSPGSTVVTAAALHRATAQSRGVELAIVQVPDEEIVVRGPAMALARSLTNLLSNAVRYTDQGSIQVGVTLAERSTGRHEITLSVRDTGIGIPPEVIDHVLRVAKGEAPTPVASRRDGDGLGLVGTASLLHAVGGRIEIDSSPSGSCVCVRIPVSRTRQVARAAG